MAKIGGIEVTSKTIDSLKETEKQAILKAATKEELQLFNFDNSGSIDSAREIATYFNTLKARLATEENKNDVKTDWPLNTSEAEAKVFDFNGDGKIDSDTEISAFRYYKQQKTAAQNDKLISNKSDFNNLDNKKHTFSNNSKTDSNCQDIFSNSKYKADNKYIQ